MNGIVTPIVHDGRTGFDQFGQLVSWSLPNSEGESTGVLIRDVRCMVCKICNRGWQLTSESLQDQARLDEWVVHKSCHNGWTALRSHFEIQGMLIRAGYLFRDEEIPSQYPDSPPWKRVTILQNDRDRTPVEGKYVIIGERRRVWEIQAFGFGDLGALFSDVENTKGFVPADRLHSRFYVHAWDENQSVDYLTRIRRAIPLNTSRLNA